MLAVSKPRGGRTSRDLWTIDSKRDAVFEWYRRALTGDRAARVHTAFFELVADAQRRLGALTWMYLAEALAFERKHVCKV